MFCYSYRISILIIFSKLFKFVHVLFNAFLVHCCVYSSSSHAHPFYAFLSYFFFLFYDFLQHHFLGFMIPLHHCILILFFFSILFSSSFIIQASFLHISRSLFPFLPIPLFLIISFSPISPSISSPSPISSWYSCGLIHFFLCFLYS